MATDLQRVKATSKTLTFVSITRKSGYDEFRVSYRGLLPERTEATAYYTDDADDAIGTAQTMERDYWLMVHEQDKTSATRLRDYSLLNTAKLKELN